MGELPNLKIYFFVFEDLLERHAAKKVEAEQTKQSQQQEQVSTSTIYYSNP